MRGVSAFNRWTINIFLIFLMSDRSCQKGVVGLWGRYEGKESLFYFDKKGIKRLK